MTTAVRILIGLLLTGLMYSSQSLADGDESNSIQPVIPKGKGETCIADNDFMRRNHMDMLKHDRDLTMHEGIRDIDFSLKACIDCHAVKDETGKAVTVKDERHFCRSCHDFAAVTVDCFQCHASTPSTADKPMPKDKVHSTLTQGDANP